MMEFIFNISKDMVRNTFNNIFFRMILRYFNIKNNLSEVP